MIIEAYNWPDFDKLVCQLPIVSVDVHQPLPSFNAMQRPRCSNGTVWIPRGVPSRV